MFIEFKPNILCHRTISNWLFTNYNLFNESVYIQLYHISTYKRTYLTHENRLFYKDTQVQTLHITPLMHIASRGKQNQKVINHEKKNSLKIDIQSKGESSVVR